MSVIKMIPSIQDNNNINTMIQYSNIQSNTVAKTVIEYAKNIEELVTLRKILRAAKRGIDLDTAIESFAQENCPPNIPKDVDLDCCSVECETCWKYYIEQYLKESKENVKL